MSEKFKEGDIVMTKEGRAKVLHYLPETFTVVVRLESTGHMQALPSFEVKKNKEEMPDLLEDY